MPTRRPYSTDLSDEEWEILRPLVPEAKPGGRPRAHQTRELLNAIFYVLRGGSAPEGYFPTISCRGRAPTITSELGAWTEPGRASTPPYARGCADCRVESLLPAQRSSTPRRPRPPRRAASALMTGARRSAAEKATFARRHGWLGDRSGGTRGEHLRSGWREALA
jgi:Putative transposase of IS4/5 family (DUF4096)